MATFERKPPAPVGRTLLDWLAVVGLVVAVLLMTAAVVVYLI